MWNVTAEAELYSCVTNVVDFNRLHCFGTIVSATGERLTCKQHFFAWHTGIFFTLL